MSTNKRVYNKIKSHLALKGIKNKELAEHLGVSDQTVSRWCTNAGQPSIPELYDIAKFLQVSVSELLIEQE